MNHRKWTRTGRQLDLPSGQRVWTGGIGQQNVQLADGDFAPFEIFPLERRIRIGADAEIIVLADGFQYWVGGVLQMEWDLQPQRQQGPNWNSVNPTKSLVIIQPETDVLGNIHSCEITYSLGSGNFDTDVKVRVGGGKIVAMGATMRANSNGRYRILAPNTRGLWTPRPRIDKATGQPGTPVHYKSGDMNWAWQPNEIPLHEIEEDVSSTSFALGTGDMNGGDTVVISPDTTGALTIDDEADDGDDNSNGTWDANPGIIYFDWDAGVRMCGWRFRAVDLGGTPDTIDAGTQFVFPDIGGSGENYDCNWTATAVDANQPAIFTTPGNEPDDASVTTANQTGTYNGSTFVGATEDFESIVTELVETSGYSYDGAAADAINIRFELTSSGSTYIAVCDDYGGSSQPTLTIVYTPAAGGPETVEKTLADTFVLSDSSLRDGVFVR